MANIRFIFKLKRRIFFRRFPLLIKIQDISLSFFINLFLVFHLPKYAHVGGGLPDHCRGRY